MHSLITINGKAFPAPDRGLTPTIATLVSAGKNANGEFVGQKVGRDQLKYDNMIWSYLKADTWAAMLQEFKKFECTVQLANPETNAWVTIRMYPGNRTCEPLTLDPRTGLPKDYINCKCDIVDMGFVDDTEDL